MNKSVYAAAKSRRSIYKYKDAIPISDMRLREILAFFLKHGPSPNNSQSARMALLLGNHHKKLWDIVLAAIGSKAKPTTHEKITKFRDGYGTILFFDDTAVTQKLARELSENPERFKDWAHQANAMLQFSIWSAFAAEGIGASLQHYNPIIDNMVRETWGIPAEYELIAQMPFGAPDEKAWDRTYLPIEERMRVFEVKEKAGI